MVELLCAIAIIAFLLAMTVPIIGSHFTAALRQSDKQTLWVLNNSLNRYKCEGGDIAALTQGKSFNNLLQALSRTVNWSGLSHQFWQSGNSLPNARTIEAYGDGKNYRLTRFNNYQEDSSGSAISLTRLAYLVSTLAGSGSETYADGTGTAASFYWPNGVAVDGSGNVYVADDSNNRIRKITPAGVVTTLAGSGSFAFANGTGTAASFGYPDGVAVDGSGNVYVGDTGNQRIRKITPAGVVTTLAGSGSFAFANGTGTAASFKNPRGVAVDSSGNVYVADCTNHRIRKITPAGVVTTLAGSGTGTYADGTGTAASFNYPCGVAVDSSGNVYVADTSNHRIRKITPAGVVTTLAGSGTGTYADGTGTAASFNEPNGVAVDSGGNVYVADSSNNRIRKITPAGVVTTLAGSGSDAFADGSGTAAKFNGPIGIAIDSSANIYVADTYNNRIRKITP